MDNEEGNIEEQNIAVQNIAELNIELQNTAGGNIDDMKSIKNLLFTKCIPNYVVPAYAEKYKLYPCIECGDKFIFECSYQDHMNRKSAMITYMCPHCKEKKLFYNRCSLLSHIRTHCPKTAIVELKDLTVESLPLSFFNILSSEDNSIPKPKTTCYECKQDISFSGSPRNDRERHFMQLTTEKYRCPVCLLPLLTECGLKAHLRLHLKCPPYYCPHCGVQLSNKNTRYPYDHDCKGFDMMRASTRLKCPINEKCPFFRPNDHEEHMKEYHLNKVYKCQRCGAACFDESSMQNHLINHSRDANALLLYQCAECRGDLMLHNQIKQHLKYHISPITYPCWTCEIAYKEINELLLHHINKHLNCDLNLSQQFLSVMSQHKNELNKRRRYLVAKRCNHCKKTFMYKCTHSKITTLPNICPNKCFTSLQSTKIISDGFESSGTESELVCYMCKSEISQGWEEIKKHYAIHHKEYRCLDIKVNLTKIDINQYIKKDIKKTLKVNGTEKNNSKSSKLKEIKTTEGATHQKPVLSVANEYKCIKCDFRCSAIKVLEQHIITHRDPFMAYQCMECAKSFMVKTSFSIHLLLEHNITNVENYIISKPCYNADAIWKVPQNKEINEPVGENQCSVCRDQLENSVSLEKHFRIHGMAFLKKHIEHQKQKKRNQ